MSSLHMLFALLEQAVVWLALLAVLMGRYLHKQPQRSAVLLVMLAVVLLVPIHGLTLGAWLRSIIGDLSMTGLILFADIAIKRVFDFQLVSGESRKWLLRGIVPAGLMFYPLALGVTALDPYQWGYAPLLPVIVIAGIALWAWLKGMRNLAVILLLPVLAFHLHLLESPNLWDYLLDPVVFVYALLQGLILPLVCYLRINP